MVDKSLNIALENIVRNNKEFNSNQDTDKVSKLEQKIQNLLNDKGNLNSSEVMILRGEASMLTRLADYAENLADKLEKDHKELQKKKLEEVQKALMEELGIPAEFVDQLAILVKAGPQALREAAGVYRAEAEKKKEKAEFIATEVDRLDRQIKELSHIKDSLTLQTGEQSVSMKDYILKVRYQEALRDKSDLILKQVLEQMEGMNGEEISKGI